MTCAMTRRSRLPTIARATTGVTAVLLLFLPTVSGHQGVQGHIASHPAQHAVNNSIRLLTCRWDDLVDASLLPDYWNSEGLIDTRIKTNGEPPEQLVKVTDRRHRFPVFATACSLAFLLTIIAIIVVCTH